MCGEPRHGTPLPAHERNKDAATAEHAPTVESVLGELPLQSADAAERLRRALGLPHGEQRGSGGPPAAAPLGLALHVDGLPAWVETVASLGLAGLVTAAILIVTLKVARAVRERAPPLAVVAFDEHGMPVGFTRDQLAALHAPIKHWDEKGTIRARGSQQKVSPTGVWDALGLRCAVANGDADLQRVLVDAGLGGVTVVYLVQQFPAGARGAGPVAHGRVITMSRTEGDLLDRGVTEPARATLEQVVARWADQSAATPERAWEGLDRSGVFTGLAMAEAAAAETLLNALGPIVNGLVAGVGDEAAIGRARAMWERAAAMLASVGVFADSVPTAGRLLETPMDSAQEQLEELRVQLELIHRFAGLSAAASELLLGYPGEFREFREVFEGLEGDRASRREQLGSRGGLDGMLADLAGIRGELEDMRTDFGSEPGALEAIDELVADSTGPSGTSARCTTTSSRPSGMIRRTGGARWRSSGSPGQPWCFRPRRVPVVSPRPSRPVPGRVASCRRA